MLWILLTFVHVLVCLFLIAVVLLQSGKAADLAGAFGGMGSQTAFGPRGAATALSRATTIAAALFMVTSLSLSLVATRSEGGAATVLDSTGATKKVAEPVKADPKSQSSTPVQIPGQPAPGTIDPKNAQAPTVELPGGRKVQLPGPGQPGGLVIPEGTPQAEIERRVKAEMERLKKLQEEAEKKAAASPGGAVAPAAAPKPDAPKK